MPGLVTVTVAPASVNLTTLEHVNEELGVSPGEDTGYLNRLIARASSLIASHCGRVFGVQTVTETFRFGWQQSTSPLTMEVAPYGTPLNAQYKPVILTHAPLNVSSIEITEGGTALTAEQFEVDGPAGLVYRLQGTVRSTWGASDLSIVYQAGYQLPGGEAIDGVPELPDMVEACCIALVAAAYASRGRDPAVVRDQIEGVGMIQYAARPAVMSMTIDEGMAAVLAPYRARVW